MRHWLAYGAVVALSLTGCSFSGAPGDVDEIDPTEPDAAADDEVDATAQPSCVTPPAGIVAWWDGEVLGVDRAGNFDGTVERGSPSVDPDGVVGQTARFDNNEEIEFNPAPQAAAFTIEAWVRRRDDDNDYRTIYGEFNAAGFFLHEHQLSYWDSSVNFGTGGRVVKGATPLTADTWYHVAATWDGNDMTVYINGEPDGTASTDVTVDLPNPARVGGVSDGFGDNQSLRGDVDELSVYSRALSGDEIKAIAVAAELGKCK